MESKKCKVCHKLKSMDAFHNNKYRSDGKEIYCKECRKKYVLNYNRSKKGLLRNCYAHMRERTLGRGLKRTRYLYKGLELLSKEVFIKWSLQNANFSLIYKEWEEKDYLHNIMPSIDRIDTSKGYVLDNMRWLPLGVNNGNGCKNRRKNEKTES